MEDSIKTGEKRNIAEVSLNSEHLSMSMEANSENKGEQHDLLNVVLHSLDSLHNKLDNRFKVLEDDIHKPDTGLNDRLDMQIHETEDITSDVSTLTGKVERLEEQVSLLISLLTKKDKEIISMKADITDLRARTMRDNIIINGLEEEDHENLQTKVNDLLHKIEVNTDEGNSGPVSFDRIHRFGRNTKGPRPIVAKIHDFRDKMTIMTNAPNLKKLTEGAVPPKPQTLFINDQYPEEIAERRKQAFYKIKVNKQRPDHLQAKMKLTQDRLYINGELDKPAITRPSPAAILTYDQTEEEKMKKLKVVTGERQSEKGNSFTGLAVNVTSLADIRRAYKKVLRLPGNASAASVMCAYQLDDGTSGHYDDYEHGGGSRILNGLRNCAVRNMVLFVVRHHPPNNYKLGGGRFIHIGEAAKSALDKQLAVM